MQRGEFQGLMTTLQGFYSNKFPALHGDMATFWFESLRYHEADIVNLAAHRWARNHTLKAPSLDELQEQIAYIQEEERGAKRQGSSNKHWQDVLQDAADVQAAHSERSDEDATYGQLMARLAERSIEPWFDSQGQQHPKLTLEQRGEQCYCWARKCEAQRPQLAEDLRAAARHFGGGNVMYLGTEPGQADTPQEER